MSRNPFRYKRPQATSPQPTNQSNPADGVIIGQVQVLYGSEAATAVAYCALNA